MEANRLGLRTFEERKAGRFAYAETKAHYVDSVNRPDCFRPGTLFKGAG